MGKCSEDRIQDAIKFPADVFGKESQDEVTVFLEQRVLAPVTSVCLNIRQVLWAIQFDDKPGFRTEEIDLHVTALVELNWQLLIELKSARRCG